MQWDTGSALQGLRSLGLIGVLAAGAGGVLPIAASAQALPTGAIAPAISPGQIEKRFEPQNLPQSRAGRIELKGNEALPPDRAEAIRFKLVEIVLEGNQAIPSDRLRVLYAGLLGKEVSLSEVYRLRDAITSQYRNAGFLLVRALIPAQDISSGSVRILIAEGKINQIHITGKDDSGRVAAYAKKLQASQPLRAEEFERYVLLMDDLPGVKVRAVLSPSAGNEIGSDLDLLIEPEKIAGAVSMSNRGTQEIGPLQFYGSADLSDLQGREERTSLGLALAAPVRELRYFSLRQTELVGPEGTSLSLGYSDSLAHPGESLKLLDIVSRGQAVTLEASHPLLRARAQTLRLNASLKGSNNTVDALGTELSSDRVRLIGAGADLDVADRLGGRNLLSMQLSQGLSGLGASSPGSTTLSRPGGRPDFFRTNVSFLRQQPLTGAWLLTLAVEGQWTPDALLSSEQFAIGGEQYARAFDPSAVAGDRGYAARLEVSYRVNVTLPNLQSLELFGSTDGGGVYNKSTVVPGGWESIQSAGGGMRFQIGPNLFGTFEGEKAISIDADNHYNRGWRFFYNLRAAL